MMSADACGIASAVSHLAAHREVSTPASCGTTAFKLCRMAVDTGVTTSVSALEYMCREEVWLTMVGSR